MTARHRLAPFVDAVRVDDEVWLVSAAADDRYLVRIGATSIDEEALRTGRLVALSDEDSSGAQEVLAELIEHGLVESKQSASTGLMIHSAWPAFVPKEVCAGRWVVRGGREVLLLKANDRKALFEVFVEACCAFIQPEFQLAANAVLNGTFYVLSSATELPFAIEDVAPLCVTPAVVTKWIAVQYPNADRARLVQWPHNLPDSMVGALGRLAVQDVESLFCLVPMMGDAHSIPGKPTLSCSAVLSRHRNLELGVDVPMQIGRDEDPEVAAVKATIESLERLSGQMPRDPSSMFSLTRDELAQQFPLERFPRFQPWAHGAANATGSAMDAMQCVEIYEGEAPLPCPVEMVYYGRALAGTPRLFRANSSGMAAHFDKDCAKHSGLFELIERDALMVHWLTMRSPGALIFSDPPALRQRAIQCMSARGYDVHLLDFTLDLAPVVVAVALNRERAFPYFACGAASADTYAQACDRAVLEVETAVWAMVGKAPVQIAREDVDLPKDHATFYAEPDHFKHIEFLLSGNRSARVMPADDIADWRDASNVETEMCRRGFRCFAKDVTAEQVASLTRVVVARTLVTELLPIQFGFSNEIVNLRRVERFGSLRSRPEAPHFFA